MDGAWTREAADPDWVRRRIVELDDERRALPADAFVARDRIHRITDDLRNLLRTGNADAVHAVRAQWNDRAGRKGSREVDFEALESFVRSILPGPGTGGVG